MDDNNDKWRELHWSIRKQKNVVWSGLITQIKTLKHPDRTVTKTYRKSQPSSNVNPSKKSPVDEKWHWNSVISCTRHPIFKGPVRERAHLKPPGWRQSWTWFWLPATERYEQPSKNDFTNFRGKRRTEEDVEPYWLKYPFDNDEK